MFGKLKENTPFFRDWIISIYNYVIKKINPIITKDDPSNMSQKEVSDIETLYKLKFGSRAFGLNKN